MERLRPGGDEEKTKGDYWGDGGVCLLRLTSFHVERGQGGEPIVTARRTRSYEVSWHSRIFDAQAFWM
jgi:hypothetical protein